MCGIAGGIDAGPGRVEKMLADLRHRGPDGCAVARGPRAEMGCARLAIRGGPAGRQPLRTRRGLLVFNGEVYNLGELAAECAARGVAVDPASDTAVVGALLDLHGIRAVDRLNGMFALAWDDGERVWLARDPAGIKPLYYRGGRFSSEIRPLLDEGAALHPAAVARWLSFHVAYGEETFFAGVRRVPPGGIVELPSGRVRHRARIAFGSGAPSPALDAARLRKVLERAVRDAAPEERFGVLLSGGLDSSLVAALAPGERIAFHGRVAEPGCDEAPYARAAAAHAGLELVEVPVTAEACLEAFPRVVAALEEPVAGPGSLAQWIAAERAAREVRILLSGCGGDELFGGYARAAALVRDDPPPGLESYRPLFERVRGLAGPARAFALLDRRSGALFSRAFLDAHPPPREEFAARFFDGAPDPEAAAARAEIGIVLPGLLQVEDRVTMAFGLEARVPLLDRRLLRIAGRLGPGQRVGPDGTLKALLRAAGAPYLPHAVRGRKDKLGFPLPVGDWLRGPWRAFALEVLHDPRTRERGLYDLERAERSLDAGGRYDRALVALLAFELWLRTFVDGC